MIERKTVLAENMLRFGPKNLTKSQVSALRRLIEQAVTEIDVKNTMPKDEAALSMKFNMAHDKNTDKVTGIIGPYYLTSDSMSDDGYMGAVFAFESVTLGGSHDTGAMTLPIPVGSGRFVWQSLLAGTDGPGFNYIKFNKTTAKSMTDSNATRSTVAKIINELYNRIPLDALRAIYNGDTNKPSYDNMITNFKKSDSQRNEKILPLLTGQAADFFAYNL